ncbi:MAG: O-antigen ligase family protein [Chloroflexi bacterium]|nr:O-antigen ligase family protein [Chloroflexota bacterium]
MRAARGWVSFQWNVIATVGVVGLMAAAIGGLMPIAFARGLPLLGSKSPVFVLLLAPVLVTFALVVSRADAGFAMVVVVATALISKTGMQLDVGDIRTSALEMLVLTATFLLVARGVIVSKPPTWPSLILDRPWLMFAALTLPALLMAYVRDVTPINVLWQLKAYFLYPCLAYLIAASVTNERRWRFVLAVGLIAACIVGLTAILSWVQRGSAVELSDGGYSYADRAGGSFGIINQFGFYLSSMALVALGLLSGKPRGWNQIPGLVAPILVFAMALSGSRGAWMGFLAGLAVFLVLRRPSWPVWVGALVVVGGLLYWQWPYLQSRLPNANEDAARLDYLATGWEAFRRYPLFGAGWGASFYLDGLGRLQSADGVLQLHDDYVNLLVQVGLVGLVAFLWIWVRVIRFAVRQIRILSSHRLAGPLAGLIAGVVALLVEATTDHVFWRPDIAGQIWWITGMLLAGVALLGGSQPNEAASGS